MFVHICVCVCVCVYMSVYVYSVRAWVRACVRAFALYDKEVVCTSRSCSSLVINDSPHQIIFLVLEFLLAQWQWLEIHLRKWFITNACSSLKTSLGNFTFTAYHNFALLMQLSRNSITTCDNVIFLAVSLTLMSL